jgi:hypothetical protein
VTAYVVVPNHLPHLRSLKIWAREFHRDRDVRVVVVQDTGPLPKEDLERLSQRGVEILAYDRAMVEQDLGDLSWVIPSNSSACRSFGYLVAWRMAEEGDVVLTVDNDCWPDSLDPYWVAGHQQALASRATTEWVNTMSGLSARGLPYRVRGAHETWLNHGLWSGVPDLDAPTWLHHPDLRLPPTPAGETQVISRGVFFPMCGMNLAWRPALTPALYFGLFGPAYGFDQFDDIWAGVLVKKICDHLGYAVRSGAPSVYHRKQSDVYVNLVKQAPGMEMNEHLWQVVADIALSGTDVVSCYTELVGQLPDDLPGCPQVPDSNPHHSGQPWLVAFKEAATIWTGLFR